METTDSQQICCTFNFKLVARSGLLAEFKKVTVFEFKNQEKYVCQSRVVKQSAKNCQMRILVADCEMSKFVDKKFVFKF